MSKWYEIKLEDLTLSDDRKELQFLIDNDDQGNIWGSILVEDLNTWKEEVDKITR